MKKLIAIVLVAVLVLTLAVGSGMALADKPEKAIDQGNGCPSGPHYNLNLIGVPDKSADMTGNNGHRIFVKLWGNTKIWLTEGDDFQVLDANGTDGNGASFMLPSPIPVGWEPGDPITGTKYRVYIRALGKPNRSADMQSFVKIGDDYYYSGFYDPAMIIELERDTGKQKFENVSKQLLTVYVDVTNDATYNPKRYYLFDPRLADILWGWDYQNKGLKLAQLRFYEIPYTFPVED